MSKDCFTGANRGKMTSSALAGRCDFANAAENIQDIFIKNIRKSECQRELSRSTKSPVEVYWIAVSYERDERAYKSYSGKPASSAPQIAIKQEPVNKIRRGQGYFRSRARGGYTSGANSAGNGNRRWYICNAPNFTLEYIANCPAKGVTCNACRKLGHLELTSGVRRGTNHWRGRGRVALVKNENENHQSTYSVENRQDYQVASVN